MRLTVCILNFRRTMKKDVTANQEHLHKLKSIYFNQQSPQSTVVLINRKIKLRLVTLDESKLNTHRFRLKFTLNQKQLLMDVS